MAERAEVTSMTSKYAAARQAASELTVTHVEAIAQRYADWITSQGNEQRAVAALLAVAERSKRPEVVLQHAAELYADMADEPEAPVIDEEYLTATYAAGKSSPRDGKRVKEERKPILAIDQQYPNAFVDHKIVCVDADHVYAIGHDGALYDSRDGGATWGAKKASNGGTDHWAKSGLFYKAANGFLFTTAHPIAGGAPRIIRSTDGGTTWGTVVAAQTDVEYLGPTNICQDPVTGYLYVGEYVTVSAAAKATFKIIRSTDNGANWTTFHTFNRSGADSVRHCHAVQWDPVALRINVVCGDADVKAGIYRVNAGGTALEVAVTRDQAPADIYPGAVGLMFFPDYIAWGIDQSSDSWLVRMARTQLGQPSPVVEKVARIQSTAFYTARLTSDNTEWLMTVSDENGTGGRLDNAQHIYRVADNGATIDEVGTFATQSPTNFSWTYPLSTPLQNNNDGVVWLGSNVPSASDAWHPEIHGFQFASRIAWGNGTPIIRPRDAFYRIHYAPASASWAGSLTALEKKPFAVTEVPLGAKRLYIIETNREQLAGTGFFYVEVCTYTGTAPALTYTLLKMEDGTTDMQWQHRSRRAALQQAASPYIARSAVLSPGTKIAFRVNEILNNTADGVAGITYAWGY